MIFVVQMHFQDFHLVNIDRVFSKVLTFINADSLQYTSIALLLKACWNVVSWLDYPIAFGVISELLWLLIKVSFVLVFHMIFNMPDVEPM